MNRVRILALGILTAVFALWLNFPGFEVHVLDFKQKLSFRAPPANPIVVRNLPLRRAQAPDSFQEAKSFLLNELAQIQVGQPAAIVLVLERTSLTDRADDPRLVGLLKILEAYPNLFLYEEHQRKYVGSEPPLNTFPRVLHFPTKTHDIAGIPPDDSHSRRLFLYYHEGTGLEDVFSFLSDTLKRPLMPQNFLGSFEFMQTEQAYLKFWPANSFTQVGPVPMGALKGKIVLLGFDDIFNYAFSFAPTGKSYQDDSSSALKWEPTLAEHEFLASVFENAIALRGVRTLKPIWGQIYIFIFCLVLAYFCLTLQKPKDIFLVVGWLVLGNAIPFLAFFVGDWYLPSVPTALASLFLPYVSLPIVLYRAMKRRTLDQVETEKRVESLRQEGRLAARSAEADASFRLATRVAHDIRSPLSALQIIAGLIPAEDSKSELMKRSVSRLDEIASSLLTSYKVSGGFGERQTQLCYVERLTSDLLNHSSRVFPEIALEIVNPTPIMHFEGSSVELERILFNLLTNAVEALRMSDTPQPRIVVQISEEEGWDVLRFSDNGPGIPKEIMPKLFREGATFGKATGTGLGLASARAYLQKIGGTMELEAVPKGACFCLRLPKSSAVAEVLWQDYIVIADDDQDVLSAIGKQIEDPTRALVTSDPVEALNKIRELLKGKQRFTLFTDLVFHQSNLIGFDLISETQSSNLVRRVLYTTLAGEAQIQAVCERSSIQLLDKRSVPKIRRRI